MFYIPPENECFRKCLESIYKKDPSQQYREDVQGSYRCENIMTKAKIQPLCEKHNINLGVYNVKNVKVLPATVTEKRISLFFMTTIFAFFGENVSHLLLMLDEKLNKFLNTKTIKLLMIF